MLWASFHQPEKASCQWTRSRPCANNQTGPLDAEVQWRCLRHLANAPRQHIRTTEPSVCKPATPIWTASTPSEPPRSFALLETIGERCCHVTASVTLLCRWKLRSSQLAAQRNPRDAPITTFVQESRAFPGVPPIPRSSLVLWQSLQSASYWKH